MLTPEQRARYTASQREARARARAKRGPHVQPESESSRRMDEMARATLPAMREYRSDWAYHVDATPLAEIAGGWNE